MFDTIRAAADTDSTKYDHEGLVREAAAAGMPEPLARAMLALSYQRCHPNGYVEVINDFDEVVSVYLAAMAPARPAPAEKPSGVFDGLTLTRSVLTNLPRRQRALGDRKAAFYLPTNSSMDIMAAVALSNGTYRTLSFDARELASLMWKALGA